MLRYTWDPEKNRKNVARHHISFVDAIHIFEGITVEKEDDRYEYGEIRVYAIGVVIGVEITVIYTDRGDDERRMIAAWRAEPHERRYYWRNINA